MSSETPQDSMPEADLDDILSEAANLASSLKEEIGDSDDPAAAAAPDPINDVKTGTTDTVECELHELERLVASTSEQVGAEASDADSGEASTPAEPVDETASSESSAAESSAAEPSESETSEPDSPAAEAPAKSKPTAVPDFMSEFTEPEAPQEAKPEAAPTETQTAEPTAAEDAPASSVGADPLSDPKPGVVGAPIAQAAAAPSVESASEPQTLAEPESDTSATHSPKATADDALRALVRRLGPVGLAVCAKVVLLLEMIDRPLGRIGAAPRILLGWLAIATLGVATIVYVISLW